MRRTGFTIVALCCLTSLGQLASAQPGQEPGQRAAPPGQAAAQDANAADLFAEPNVVLEDLVRRVAAETGREFLIDAAVPARIYVRGTLEETPSYPEFLSILRSNRLTAFEAGGIVNIDYDGSARTFPTRLVQVDDASIPDDEVVTRVLTLPNPVWGAQLVPILRPMLPQNAHLTAFSVGDSLSKLVIVDRYGNVKRITDVVREIVGSVEL